MNTNLEWPFPAYTFVGMLFYNFVLKYSQSHWQRRLVVFFSFQIPHFFSRLTFFCEFRLESLFFCFSVDDDVDFNESDLYPSDDSNEMRVSEKKN